MMAQTDFLNGPITFKVRISRHRLLNKSNKYSKSNSWRNNSCMLMTSPSNESIVLDQTSIQPYLSINMTHLLHFIRFTPVCPGSYISRISSLPRHKTRVTPCGRRLISIHLNASIVHKNGWSNRNCMATIYSKGQQYKHYLDWNHNVIMNPKNGHAPPGYVSGMEEHGRTVPYSLFILH